MTVPLSVTAEASGRDTLPVHPDDAGGADARSCAAVVREHARTFYFASWLLPPAKRRAAYALYAFCRVADDLVDRAQGRYGRAPSPADIARQLGEYERALDLTLAAEPGGNRRTAARRSDRERGRVPCAGADLFRRVARGDAVPPSRLPGA